MPKKNPRREILMFRGKKSIILVRKYFWEL